MQLKFLTDGKRHLICTPYSRENLHIMADQLGIKRNWFHANPIPHYDIPKKSNDIIAAHCYLVSSRDIVRIARDYYTSEQLIMLGYQFEEVEDDDGSSSS